MNKILDNLISLAGQYNNMLSYSMIARELEKHEEISPKDVKAIYGQLSNSGVNIVEYDEALDMVNLVKACCTGDFTKQEAGAQYLKQYVSDDNTAIVARAKAIDWSKVDVVTILGGGIGTIIGMYKFRHKTKKLKFTVGLPTILISEICVIIYLLYKGILQMLFI